MMKERKITHCQLTPPAVQARDPVVTLDSFSTFEAFAVTISFHPMVRHRLRRFLAFHVGGYARGWRSLDAPFMDRVLADCGKRETARLFPVSMQMKRIVS